MYPLKFPNCLTDEEQLLLEKYKLLREKKEEVQKLEIVPPKNLEDENADSAVEKAKQLVMTGQISISPQKQPTSFKRSLVLERKLTEGHELKILKKENNDDSASSSEDAPEKSQPSFSQFQAPDPTMSAHRMQPSTGAAGSNFSPDDVGWAHSNTSTNHSRKSKSSGGYFDYKRRSVKYDDSSSDSDDD